MSIRANSRDGVRVKHSLAEASEKALSIGSELAEKYLGNETDSIDRRTESIIVPHARSYFGSFLSLLGGVVVIDSISEAISEGYIVGVDTYFPPQFALEAILGVFMAYRGARMSYRALKKQATD